MVQEHLSYRWGGYIDGWFDDRLLGNPAIFFCRKNPWGIQRGLKSGKKVLETVFPFSEVIYSGQYTTE